MRIEWSANWDDSLAGGPQVSNRDPIVERLRRHAEDKVRFEYERTFMFYLRASASTA